jgi:hypothetical protein
MIESKGFRLGDVRGREASVEDKDSMWRGKTRTNARERGD